MEASLMNTIDNAANLEAIAEIDEKGKAIMEEESSRPPKEQPNAAVLRVFPTYFNDSSKHYDDYQISEPKTSTPISKIEKPFDWLGNSYEDHSTTTTTTTTTTSYSNQTSLGQVLQSHLDDEDSPSSDSQNTNSLSESNNFIKKLKLLGGSLLSPYYYVLDTVLVILIILLITIIILSYILPSFMVDIFGSIMDVTPLSLASIFLSLLIVPLWINEGYQRLLKLLSKYNQIEQANFLRKIQGSSVMLLSSFVVLFGVMSHLQDVPKYGQCGAKTFATKLPSGCSSWILSTLIPNLLIWSMITGSVQILLTHILNIIRTKFQEEAFHSKLIKNRFNIFLIDKLSLFIGIREEELRKKKGKEMQKSHRISRIITESTTALSSSTISRAAAAAAATSYTEANAKFYLLKKVHKKLLCIISKGPWLLGDFIHSILGRILNWPREAISHHLSITPEDIERNVPFLSLGNTNAGESLLDGMSKELTQNLKEETANLRSSSNALRGENQEEESLEKKIIQEDLLIDSCQTNQDCLVETDEEALSLSSNRGGNKESSSKNLLRDETPIVISEDSIIAAGPRSSLVAKLRARKIWRTVAIGKDLEMKSSSKKIVKDSITLQDLLDFFHDKNGSYSRDIVSSGDMEQTQETQLTNFLKQAFQVLDLDGNGEISREECRSALLILYEKCRNMQKSLSDRGSALMTLEETSKGCIWTGLVILLLGFLGAPISILLGFSVTLMVSLNFMFFDLANKTVNSFVFLFVIHPYDVGDSIVLRNDANFEEEEVLIVKHINIQTTLFQKWNGIEVSYMNHVISSNPITNLTRSKEQWEKIDFNLRIPTLNTSNDIVLRSDLDRQVAALTFAKNSISSFLSSYPNDYVMGGSGGSGSGGASDGGNAISSFDLKASIPSESGKGASDLEMLHMKLIVRCKRTMDVQKKWLRHARLVTFVKAMSK